MVTIRRSNGTGLSYPVTSDHGKTTYEYSGVTYEPVSLEGGASFMW